MVTLAVIIPCHNDCDAAEKLVSSFRDQTVQPDEFVIGHDKCIGNDRCLQLGNKAATINFYAKSLDTDYILILDADMVLTPTFFEAFKVAFERNKPKVGSGVVYSLSEKTVAMKNRLVGHNSVPMCWYWFGGCMYVKRSFLVANPMPTGTILEDIIYGKLLEKRGVNAGVRSQRGLLHVAEERDCDAATSTANPFHVGVIRTDSLPCEPLHVGRVLRYS